LMNSLNCIDVQRTKGPSLPIACRRSLEFDVLIPDFLLIAAIVKVCSPAAMKGEQVFLSGGVK